MHRPQVYTGPVKALSIPVEQLLTQLTAAPGTSQGGAP